MHMMKMGIMEQNNVHTADEKSKILYAKERVVKIAEIEGIEAKEYTLKSIMKKEAKILFQNFEPIRKSFIIDYFESENNMKKIRNVVKKASKSKNVTLKINFPGKTVGKLRSLFAADKPNILSDIRTIFDNAQYGYSTNYVITETRYDGSIHKEHSNIIAYHHFINKVNIDGKLYYIRFTVQELANVGQVHSALVSEVELINKISREDSRSLLGINQGGTAQPAYDSNLADFFGSVKKNDD